MNRRSMGDGVLGASIVILICKFSGPLGSMDQFSYKPSYWVTAQMLRRSLGVPDPEALPRLGASSVPSNSITLLLRSVTHSQLSPCFRACLSVFPFAVGITAVTSSPSTSGRGERITLFYLLPRLGTLVCWLTVDSLVLQHKGRHCPTFYVQGLVTWPPELQELTRYDTPRTDLKPFHGLWRCNHRGESVCVKARPSFSLW